MEVIDKTISSLTNTIRNYELGQDVYLDQAFREILCKKELLDRVRREASAVDETDTGLTQESMEEAQHEIDRLKYKIKRRSNNLVKYSEMIELNNQTLEDLKLIWKNLDQQYAAIKNHNKNELVKILKARRKVGCDELSGRNLDIDIGSIMRKCREIAVKKQRKKNDQTHRDASHRDEVDEIHLQELRDIGRQKHDQLKTLKIKEHDLEKFHKNLSLEMNWLAGQIENIKKFQQERKFRFDRRMIELDENIRLKEGVFEKLSQELLLAEKSLDEITCRT